MVNVKLHFPLNKIAGIYLDFLSDIFPPIIFLVHFKPTLQDFRLYFVLTSTLQDILKFSIILYISHVLVRPCYWY